MKKFYSCLFLFLYVSLCADATVQLETGKVYNFKNLEYGMSMASSGIVKTVIVDTDTKDLAQLWLAGDGGNGTYTLRNLGNGLYLKGKSANAGMWPFVGEASATAFYLIGAGEGYTLSMTNSINGGDKMHYGAGNGCVVGWSADARASQWEITEVAFTAEELEANWQEIRELETVSAGSVTAVYQKALDNLFADKACTVLKKSFASEAAIGNDADYKALPSDLQAMVKKVFADSWSEENANPEKEGWSGMYAKKFRVQMYEPYSIAGGITEFLGINTHANNDNPTGIYPHKRGFIYVMVDGEVKDGATLRLVDAASDDRICDAAQAGFELNSGLNIIPVYGKGGHLYICYNVETYNKENRTFPNKLSDFKPLKIHIEGGSINGFYNACGDFRAENDSEDLWKAATGASVDCDEDWEYYETRANLSVVPILGHRQIMLFPLEDTYDSDGAYQKGMKSLLPDQLSVPSTPNSRTGKWSDYGMGLDPSHRINIMMETWDRIMYSELATMGLVGEKALDKMNDMYPRWNADGTRGGIYSYGTTYRDFCGGRDYSEYFNHHGVALGTTSGYMYGGIDHCGYNVNTFNEIVSGIASTPGYVWGPSHEIGHQHQGVITLGGQTEVTNNLFANIAVWYMGMNTSRVNGDEGALESVLEAYNTAGHDLYTNNIWALEQMYYRLWLYYHLAGNNTEFYPRLFELCRQQPLENGGQLSGSTSLLRFYQHACDAAGEDLTEFFRIYGYFEVMESRMVDDYGNYYYNVTQEEIDNAIASVKAKNYKENHAIIFINDATEETTVKHDGKTLRELWDRKPTAEFGSVNDFISGDDVAVPYTATISDDGTITMSGGEGGVGFLLLDESGKVFSFSNNATFALGEEARYLLATGKAKVVAVAPDNKLVMAEVDLVKVQKGMFETLVGEIEALNIDDGTYRNVGFYTKPSAEKLLAALDNARCLLESGSSYAAAYKLLDLEYEAFVNSGNLMTVPLDPSLTYEIRNYAYPSQKMTLNSSNEVKSLKVPDAAKAIWRFVPTATDGVYNLQNAGNDCYLPAVETSKQLVAVASQSSAANYVVQETGIAGVLAIGVTPHSDYTYLHSADANGDRVVGWSTDGAATKWYLTAVEDNSNSSFAEIDELQMLASRTEALVNEVAEVYMPKTLQYELQNDDASAAYYISSNAGHNTADGNAPNYADGAGIAGLLDGDPATYFHSRWGGSLVNEVHYLQIDLGEGNEVEKFVFEYETRKSLYANVTSPAPTAIEVYAGNDKADLGDCLATYTKADDKLPAYSDLGVSWMSQVITAGGASRYLRFAVTGSQGPAASSQWNGQYYFAMGTFKLYNGEPVFKEWKPGFENMDFVNVKNAVNALVRAQETVAGSGEDVASVKSALLTAYETLFDAYISVLDQRKAELQELIDATEDVMAVVCSVTQVKEEEIELTTSNLYCNAIIAEGKLEDLLDKENSSYIHTQWEGTSTDNDYHYLRVDVGETASVGEFYFTYTTANRGYRDMPKTILVEGANNTTEDTFEEIVTLTATDGLPQEVNVNTEYVSPRLGSAGKPYRYLRFKVLETQRAGVDGGGKPYFTMAEFGVTRSAYTKIVINDEYVSCLSEDMLASVQNEITVAMEIKNLTSSLTLTLLETQMTELATVKAALERAIVQSTDKTELVEACAAADVLYRMVKERNDYYAVSDAVLSATDLLEEKKIVADGILENIFARQNAVDAACEELQAVTAALQELVSDDVADRESLSALVALAGALVDEVADRNGTAFVLKDEYASPNLQVSHVDAVYSELVATSPLLGCYVTQESYDAALGRLQVAYDALLMAKALKNIPLVVTTDVDNPVVYKIGIKRGDTKVLQYDYANTQMVSVEEYSEGNMSQGWYFTKGTDGDQLFIHPYLGGGDVLASDDVTDGPAKVQALPKDSEGYMQEWILSSLEGGQFNIKPAEGSTWFSHHGGGYNKMGFYSYSNTSDLGSIFTFEPITIAGGVWKNTLEAYVTGYCTMENIVSGTTVGCYMNGDEYNSERARAVECFCLSPKPRKIT